MITLSRFSSITGAPAPADFEQLRADVVARLEAALGRGLASGQRTEWLAVYRDGVAYPSAWPITEVPAGCRAIGDAIADVTPGRDVEVTYTGGYDEESCPADLAAAIAWGVYTLTNPAEPTLADGLSQLSIAGEYSVTREAGALLGADGALLPGRWALPIADLGGRCASLAAGYRRHR